MCLPTTQKLEHLRVVKWRLNIDLAFMKLVMVDDAAAATTQKNTKELPDDAEIHQLFERCFDRSPFEVVCCVTLRFLTRSAFFETIDHHKSLNRLCSFCLFCIDFSAYIRFIRSLRDKIFENDVQKCVFDCNVNRFYGTMQPTTIGKG